MTQAGIWYPCAWLRCNGGIGDGGIDDGGIDDETLNGVGGLGFGYTATRPSPPSSPNTGLPKHRAPETLGSPNTGPPQHRAPKHLL
ncbi:hypothetical protein K227x_55330 [Rubripirellula lacrimiformis]|uniref:Uncharacterized protein n=1 Tax=Rubripirellula lacrimiformis TaxID=1930273 RepID=A0A517NJ36_9BACT|nr:hypothetical protein K227x_55330 [Rubripirellula lacrimiformis]